MFFLVPRVTVLLLVAFFVLLAVRARRRKRFVRRPPRLTRWAVQLGQRSGRRSRRRGDKAASGTQSDSFRPS